MDRKLLLGLIGLATAFSFAAHSYRDNAPRYTPRGIAQPASEYRGAFEWLTSMRSNLSTGQIEPGDFLNMRKAVSAYLRNQPKSAAYQWIEMGPDNVGGRVRAITVDPTNPEKVWAGGVSGGLWRSLDGGNTWQNVSAFGVNLCVSSIAILGNGHLYVATGSVFESAGGQGGSGFVGAGIFMSSDDGVTFSHPLAPTAPWNQNSSWAMSNRIKADPTNPNRLWIASLNPGTRLYDESTNTVSTPNFSPASTANQDATDLDVSADGQTVLISIANKAYLSTDGGQNFVRLDNSNNGIGFPTTGIGRLEMAISPDDANYMYALACTGAGAMRGGWASTDRGGHWFQIWPDGVPSLDIFGTNRQGNYDCAIGVRKDHPDEVWVGGTSLWKYTLNGVPEQLAQEFGPPGCFYCVHSDVHEITFDNASVAFVGCDGGVYRTSSGGYSWTPYNRHLNITQFYSVAFNAQGHLLGGAQDNGSQFVPGYGVTNMEGVEVSGGDGFDADMSQLDTNIQFTTVYYGSLDRSNDGGNNSGGFYDAGVMAVATPSTPPLGVGLGDFYTNIRLHEDGNDTNSIDSVKRVFSISAGDTIFPGQTRAVPFHGAITSVVQYGSFTNPSSTDTIVGPFSSDTLKFQDRVTSQFAAGFGGTQGVWVTRDADNFNVTPAWAKVCNVNGNVNCLEWSANGDALFFGTTGGLIYRVMGFNHARTIAQMSRDSADYALTLTQMTTGSSPTVTGLGPDPNNNNNIIATFGNYGGNSKIKRCTNALQASPTFNENLWNVPTALQGMPLYDCMIDQNNSQIMLVGSEFGVWATDDDGATWSNQVDGLPQVPVFAIRQQTMNYQTNPIGPDWITNNGVIYVGSHGRGFFRTDALLGIKPIKPAGGDALGGLTIAPNPTSTQSIVSFSLAHAGDVTLNVYSLDGRMVRTVSRKNLAPLEQHIPLDVEDLESGTYIVDVLSNGSHHAARMVVAR